MKPALLIALLVLIGITLAALIFSLTYRPPAPPAQPATVTALAIVTNPDSEAPDQYAPTLAVTLVEQISPTPTTSSTEDAAAEDTTTASETPVMEELQPGQGQLFFEDFEKDAVGWQYFVTAGDESAMDIYLEGGLLVVELTSEEIAAYVLYDQITLANVTVVTTARSAAAQDKEISLVCRSTEGVGWYEFGASHTGRWAIKRYDEETDQRIILDDGNTTAIRGGEEENTYSATCSGPELSFEVNGQPVGYTVDTRLISGTAGLGITAFSDLPVVVKFDTVAFLEP